jgi:hypothetical protein
MAASVDEAPSKPEITLLHLEAKVGATVCEFGF